MKITCTCMSQLTTRRVLTLELSNSLVFVNHAYFKLVFVDPLILCDVYFVNYVNICRITLWKNTDMCENMFSRGTVVVITYHSLLCCGKDATDDSELCVTQLSVNYRYALLVLWLVQMWVLQSPVLPLATSSLDSDPFPLTP